MLDATVKEDRERVDSVRAGAKHRTMRHKASVDDPADALAVVRASPARPPVAGANQTAGQRSTTRSEVVRLRVSRLLVPGAV
jgi:hypothetical protein